MQVENILDDLENVCRDNYRQIRENKNCYIYKETVLKRTIELCESDNLNYKLFNCEDYYSIVGINNSSKKERRKNRGKKNQF